MVQEMLGNVLAEKIEGEILLKCLKSIIKQNKFLLENSSQFLYGVPIVKKLV